MPNYRKITQSGQNVIEIEYIQSKDRGAATKTRQQSEGITNASQQLANYFNIIRRVSRLANANFTEEDLFITLTYRGKIQPTPEEAKQKINQFFRDIRKLRGVLRMPEPKYLEVTENKKRNRIHHHALINKMSMDDVCRIWPHGRVIASPLEPGEYTGIAHYILKDMAEPNQRRYKYSKNLIRPESVYEPISRATLESELPEIPGFKVVYNTTTCIDQETHKSIYRYWKLTREGTEDIATGGKEINEDGNEKF
jgi:hypothetical protein